MSIKQSLLTRSLTRSSAINTMQWSALADPLVDIVVPCHNESATLAQNIIILHTYLKSDSFPYRFMLTIADSASTDGTEQVARELAKKLSNVRVSREKIKGRGRALKSAWHSSKGDIVAYMDEDLSTDITQLPTLIAPLANSTTALAVGSRLSKTSQVTRSLKREILSRGYVYILKRALKMGVSDAQCGFKAMRRDAFKRIASEIHDDKWFFDTELIIKSEQRGWRVHELPVRWLEDKDSRVNIIETVRDDLKGVARLRAETGQRVRPATWAFAALLVTTAILYLWNLSINDLANSYYAAAVQAASSDWKAFFFGSLDAGNYITVDKPPFAVQVMALSARIFGFSSWSMLLPNALAGVGTVALVYASVKHFFGSNRALIAGILMALTPVAALMFRFNNPDAILTFLLAASGYAFIRGFDQKNIFMWLGLAGLFTGMAFNTKMLQGLILLPIMGLVYLLFAKASVIKRIIHLVFAGVITTVASLWWAVAVWLTPAANRPYIGSSTSNSIWDLILGYNGLGRLLGSGAGQGGMGGGTGMGSMGGSMGAAFGGQTGILRIFNEAFGPNIGWFLILALISGGLLLWTLRKAPWKSTQRAVILFWLGWIVLHIAVFSITSGVIHPYYVVVMAPAVAMLVGVGIPSLITSYKRRNGTACMLPTAVLATGVIATILLGYSNTLVWVSWITLAATLVSTVVLTINLLLARQKLATIGLVSGAIAILFAPTAFTISTVAVKHTGSIPTSGPQATAMGGTNNESSSADSALVEYLLVHQGSAIWIAATDSANSSAAVQISSGQPVMALGGFNGGDAAITLDEFKQLVSEGKVKYYIASSTGRGMGGGPGMRGSSEILSWITANATTIDYGGSNSVTLYQLSTN